MVVKSVKGRKKKSTNEEKAIKLLQDPKLLFKMGQKVAELGIVGEDSNRLVLALAGIGRTLPEPASVMVKGSSSSGKSQLLRSVLELFPPDCVVERAGLSGKALVNRRDSLRAKILHLLEYRCGKDSQLLLRLLQSDQKISHEYTTISGARRGTQTAERDGSPVVLTTTTDPKVFEDDETRFLSVWADESADQTKAILVARAGGPAIVDRGDLPVWQHSMSLLTFRDGDFEHPPAWLRYVAEQLPLGKVRVRRDWARFLTFLNAIALCRGDYQVEAPLDVTFPDYCVAYLILEPVFASTLKGVRTQDLALGTAVARLNRLHKRAVTVREVAAELKWKESLVYKRAKGAAQRKVVDYEAGTRERNEKRLTAREDVNEGFLPKPAVVLKENSDLDGEVEYVNPFTGELETLLRSRSRPVKT
jgi:hypothetical protein